MCCFLLYPL